MVRHQTVYTLRVCSCVFQRRGDPCAAKIFTAAQSASTVRVKQNEIEFMRMLSHANIVRFFAIEQEVVSSHSPDGASLQSACPN